MQLPWRSLHRPAPRPVPPAWPPTATTLLTGLIVAGTASQWLLRRPEPLPFDPILVSDALSWPGLKARCWWELCAHLFLQTGPVALLPVSLVVLWLAGRPLERIIGRGHLFLLFGLAGVLGGLGQVGFDALLDRQLPVAGPSSAVMGLLLALSCVSPRAPLLPWKQSGSLRRIQVIHGTLGALAATVVAGTHPPAAGALVGGLTGCLYMHALGFGRHAPQVDIPDATPTPRASSASWPLRPSLSRKAPTTRRFTEQEQQMSPREFIAARIDPILEKITREGSDSLTPDEHQLLKKAREKFLNLEIGSDSSN